MDGTGWAGARGGYLGRENLNTIGRENSHPIGRENSDTTGCDNSDTIGRENSHMVGRENSLRYTVTKSRQAEFMYGIG